MENTITLALHGFLGLPNDWHPWHQRYGADSALRAFNLWQHPTLNSSFSLKDWTTQFSQFAFDLKRATNASIHLWGYSMGGRLALGALIANPELFTRATIISANPGLENQTERNSRFKRDQEWAHRFLKEKWNVVIEAWDSQPVLREPIGVDNPVERREEDYTREALSQALLNWSIAHQPNYWPELSRVTTPIDWHVGEFDSSYLAIGERAASANSKIQLRVHPKIGHRLLAHSKL